MNAPPAISQESADRLADALEKLENARVDLVTAPAGLKPARALDYLQVREASSPAFEAAQREYELLKAGASTPGAPPVDAEVPAEVDGINVLPPPNEIVTAENVAEFAGGIGYFVANAEKSVAVEVTRLAFGPGTQVAVLDNGAISTVALSEPMLLQLISGGLIPIPVTGFANAYTEVSDLPEESQEDLPPAPAAGEPAAPQGTPPPAAPAE